MMPIDQLDYFLKLTRNEDNTTEQNRHRYSAWHLVYLFCKFALNTECSDGGASYASCSKPCQVKQG